MVDSKTGQRDHHAKRRSSIPNFPSDDLPADVNVAWFKRDLRSNDHAPLVEAAATPQRPRAGCTPGKLFISRRQ